MNIFTLLFGLVLAVVLTLIYVVWRGKTSELSLQQEVTPEWLSLLAKRDEIEHDQTLSADVKQTLRAEWAVLADSILASQQSESIQATCMPVKSVVALMVTIFLIGIVTYLSVGRLSQESLQWPPVKAENPMEVAGEPPVEEGAKHPGDNETLEQRVAKLEEKLKKNPNDVDGWVLLARSRGFQRDFAGEVDALRHALALVPDHPDLMADLADTVAMVNNKSLAGEPMELIHKVLKVDPKHRKGLALAATAAMQRKDKPQALNYWHQLRATYPENAPDLAKIDEILAQLGDPEAMANVANNTQSENTQSAASAAQSSRNQEASASADGAAIDGTVSIDRTVLKQIKQPLPETAKLFVFAKMESGPPMPLAVMRDSPEALLKGETLPFKLDDSMAMSPAMKLSSNTSVNVEARISMSGNAIKQPGDWYVMIPSVKVGAKGLHLVIQSEVK